MRIRIEQAVRQKTDASPGKGEVNRAAQIDLFG
jgi:hypothetical protein